MRNEDPENRPTQLEMVVAVHVITNITKYILVLNPDFNYSLNITESDSFVLGSQILFQHYSFALRPWCCQQEGCYCNRLQDLH